MAYVTLISGLVLNRFTFQQILDLSSSSPISPTRVTEIALSPGFEMDWQGQKLAEHLMQILLVISGIVAFITGYITESFSTMMLIYAGGVGVTTLITIPNWPFFNRCPLNWLDPSEAEKHPKPEVVVSSKKKLSKK